MHETLLTSEESALAEDLGDYFRIPADNRDLNYEKYFSYGSIRNTQRSERMAYSSNNTVLLSVDQLKEKLLSTEYIRNELAAWKSTRRIYRLRRA